MDAAALLRGVAAGFAATAVMMVMETYAWAQWGLAAVFEWQETDALVRRMLGRRSMRSALVLHLLIGAVGGVVFGVVLAVVPTAPPLALGAGFGLLFWVLTLLGHARVTGSPARGVGVAVSLVSHLVYGLLLGWWVA